MLKYTLCRDLKTGKEWIETDLRGKELLVTYLLNKSTAFTEEEREQLGLLGKLPAKIETLEEQITRAYHQYKKYKSDLQRHIYLNNMHDKNEILFYKLVTDHLVEMIPILYTPIVGQSVKEYSHEFRQPRGMYIAYPNQDKIEKILENRTHPDVSVIVVTDGERVLGIGDQGVGAINIPIAKLMLYTMCGGLDPYRTLPIVLDVGTNNKKLLKDPLYLGWRHPRIQGEEYDRFIEKFVGSIQKSMPSVFLHWEDFGRDNARRILERYQNQLCTFNDDMQGTSVVAAAAILTATERNAEVLSDQRIVIFGAGTAGVGIADRLVDCMMRQGTSKSKALEKIWLIDKDGLLVKETPNLAPFQLPYVRDAATGMVLEQVVSKIKPTILIGCSAMGGAFTENIVRQMASEVSRPIILPLSNPNQQSEADPNDLLRWTNNRALIATGSPYGGIVAQCNNAFSFPGIGLGVIAARATRLTDNMLWVACQTLSQMAPKSMDGFLLPSLSEARTAAYRIAIALVNEAKREGVSLLDANMDAETAVQNIIWEPYYRPIRPRKSR